MSFFKYFPSIPIEFSSHPEVFWDILTKHFRDIFGLSIKQILEKIKTIRQQNTGVYRLSTPDFFLIITTPGARKKFREKSFSPNFFGDWIKSVKRLWLHWRIILTIQGLDKNFIFFLLFLTLKIFFHDFVLSREQNWVFFHQISHEVFIEGPGRA